MRTPNKMAAEPHQRDRLLSWTVERNHSCGHRYVPVLARRPGTAWPSQYRAEVSVDTRSVRAHRQRAVAASAALLTGVERRTSSGRRPPTTSSAGADQSVSGTLGEHVTRACVPPMKTDIVAPARPPLGRRNGIPGPADALGRGVL